MKSSIPLSLAAILAMTVVPVMGQDDAALSFDDILGEWNVNYVSGRTSTFTISKDDDGTPTIIVKTEFGEGEAREIVIDGDMITFQSEVVDGSGQTIRSEYIVKYSDGMLAGTGKTTGRPGDVEGARVFFATKAESLDEPVTTL